MTELHFDAAEFVAALRSHNPIERALAQLMEMPQRFDIFEIEAVASDLRRRLWKKPREQKKSTTIGAPKRPGQELIHIWIAVEAEARAARRAKPDIGVERAIEDKFRRLPRSAGGTWRLLTDRTGNGNHIELLSSKTATRLHRDAIMLIKGERPLENGGRMSEAQRANLEKYVDFIVKALLKKSAISA